MVRTPHFHCRGHGPDPGQGTKIPPCHSARSKEEEGGGEASELGQGWVGGTHGNSVSLGQLHSWNSTDH